MPRSLLDQLGQIDGSGTYSDTVSGIHTEVVAEGQDSLEGDLNVVRSLLKDLQGTTNWYDSTDMTVQGIAQKFFIVDLHQSGFDNVSVSGSTTTAFDTAIKTITDHNDGGGNSTTTGVILNGTVAYKLSLRDHATQNPISDGNDNEVYGRLTWNGTAYVVSFYSMVSGTETAYTFASAQAIDLAYVCVSHRYEDLPWERFLDFTFWDLAGPIGTISDNSVSVSGMAYLYNGLTTQHQINVQGDKLGHADTQNEGVTLLKINNTGTGGAGSYFTSGGTNVNLQTVINELSAQIGGLTSTTYTFTGGTGALLTDNDFIYPALDKLDQGWVNLAAYDTAGAGANLVGVEDSATVFAATTVEGVLKELYDAIQDVTGWIKVSTTTSGVISAGSNITIPGSQSYTPAAGGVNLDWYVDGQLQLAGTGNDYEEVAGSPSTAIKTLFTIPTGTNLTFMIRK